MDIQRWDNDWNSILREVIFADSELKTLMKVPSNTSITTFIEKYFIRAGYTNKLLENEHVRIVYADVRGSNLNTPNVRQNMLTFDIYVKLEDVYNVGRDRLQMRTHLIGNRIIKLLTKDTYVNNTGYRFRPAGEWDQGTRTVGYARYTVGLYYKKVY